FPCTRLTFSLRDKAKGKGPTWSVQLWISKEVKGIVAEEIGNDTGVKASVKLLGFGTAESTVWGKAPDRRAFGGIDHQTHPRGAPLPLAGTTTKNEKVELATMPGPVLVHFYSTWDECEEELAWLALIEKTYGPHGLKIVGVASVPAERRPAWDEYLKKH